MSKLSKYALLPILIISAWILFWLAVSVTNLPSIIKPNYEVIIYVLLFIFFTIAGGLLVAAVLGRSSAITIINSYKIKLQIGQLRWLFWFAFWLSLPAVLFLAYRAYYFTQIYSYEYLRLATYGLGEAVGIDFHLYGGNGVMRIFNYLISPLIELMTLIGIALAITNKKYIYIIASLSVGSIYAIATFGRFFLYYYIILLLFYIYMFKFCRLHEATSIFRPLGGIKQVFGLSKIAIMMLIIVTFFVILLISSLRQSQIDLFELLSHYLINYHVAGFSLFTHALEDPASPLHQHLGFGRAIAFSPTYFLYDVFRQLGFDTWYPLADYFEYTSQSFDVGRSGYSQQRFNAYYTVLYFLYIDGRVIGIIVGALLFGFFITLVTHLWVRRNDFYALIIMGLLFKALFGSVFNAPIVSHAFFFSLLIILFARFFNVGKSLTLPEGQ